MLLPIQQVLHDPETVSLRLLSLFGVDQRPFLAAIQNGFNKRNEVTANHPKTFGGTCHYAEGTASLREKLYPIMDYEKFEVRNSDWVLNKNLGVLINFMSGNSSVGIKDLGASNDKPLKKKNAANRNPKGIMFSEIAKAQLGVDLFTNIFPVDIWCWVLMYFIDYKNHTIRSEISCPSKLSANGKFFLEYYERIILSEIGFDPESDFDNITNPSPYQSPEITIDFDVLRKT